VVLTVIPAQKDLLYPTTPASLTVVMFQIVISVHLQEYAPAVIPITLFRLTTLAFYAISLTVSPAIKPKHVLSAKPVSKE